MAGTALGNTLSTTIDNDAVSFKLDDIATDPISVSPTELIHGVGIDHGSVHKDAFIGGGQVLQVAVEELAQEPFGDEGQERFVTENVHAEQGVDKQVSRDNPFIRARKDTGFGSTLCSSEFQCFNGRCTTADNGNLLRLCFDAVELARVADLALELVRSLERGHDGITTGANSSDEAVEPAVARVIDDPAALLVLIRLVDLEVELCAFAKTVSFPE